LGDYEVKLIWDNKPDLLFDKIIRKVKEKHPSANAVIIADDLESAQAIIIK